MDTASLIIEVTAMFIRSILFLQSRVGVIFQIFFVIVVYHGMFWRSGMTPKGVWHV